MTFKADYVRSQGQTRRHHCHWPGCSAQVPPAAWGCRPHWYQLPKAIRDKIWTTFQPGQETTRTPSRAYLEAAAAARRWIAERLALPCKDQGQTADAAGACLRCGKAPAQACKWPHVQGPAHD